MKKDDLVSVIVPTYNSEKTIIDTVESILLQTHSNFELIIIDDGSTDNTREVINSINDSRIRYIYKENEGISSALNLGLKEANSDYIARIDSDDIAYPMRLEIQYKYLQRHNNVVLLGTSVDYIDNNGRKIGKTFPIIFSSLQSLVFQSRNIYSHPSVMFRKSSVMRVGGYDLALSGLMEDYFLWSKLKKIGKCKNLCLSLTKYRISSNQITSFSASKLYREVECRIINNQSYDSKDIEILLEEKKKAKNRDPSFSGSRVLRIENNFFYRVYSALIKLRVNNYYASFFVTVLKNIQVLLWSIKI